MTAKIKVSLTIDRDSYNTQATAKLEISSYVDDEFVTVKLSDDDREVWIRTSDLMAAMKAVGAQL